MRCVLSAFQWEAGKTSLLHRGKQNLKMGFKLNIQLTGNDRKTDALKPTSHLNLKSPLEAVDENMCISETYSSALMTKHVFAYEK